MCADNLLFAPFGISSWGARYGPEAQEGARRSERPGVNEGVSEAVLGISGLVWSSGASGPFLIDSWPSG